MGEDAGRSSLLTWDLFLEPTEEKTDSQRLFRGACTLLSNPSHPILINRKKKIHEFHSVRWAVRTSEVCLKENVETSEGRPHGT